MTQTWDDIHRARQWGAYPHDHVVRFVLRHWGAVPDRTRVHFLDVGCGFGAQTWFLAREGFKVRGLDISATALQRLGARLRAEDLSAKVALQVSDIARAKLPPGTFDCAIDCCTLQHLEPEAAAEAMALIYRSLRPQGAMLSLMASTAHSPMPAAGPPMWTRDPAQVADLFKGFREVRLGRELTMGPVGLGGYEPLGERVESFDCPAVGRWIVEAVK